MTAMALAVRHDCRYCTAAHTNALDAMGVPSRVIDSCASDPELSELPAPQRVVVQFALKAASDPKSVTDEDFRVLRDRGVSNGEIMEILMTVACANSTDFWAEVSAVTLDGRDESPE